MADKKDKQQSRLWDKGEELDQQVHAFTIGTDPLVDLVLVRWDAIGSAAQAKMLCEIGILSAAEKKSLLTALKTVLQASDKGEFYIPPELEDCHTTLENYLTEVAGEAGGKIHTGRSRNDQVLLAMRLFMRHHLVQFVRGVLQVSEELLNRYSQDGKVPLPGYTHLQPGMPSSVGMWSHAFAESFLEAAVEGLSLLDLMDRNPLGAGSGFGVPLPLDRKYVATLLGFSGVQSNPIDVQNSRGRYELKLLRWISDIGSLTEKIAWDVLLFSMKEFGLFRLPMELTTGSSIMPQKHNPDVLELLRAQSGQLRASEDEVRWIVAKLPSNYHRDFQFTKEPLVRGVRVLGYGLPVLKKVIASFQVDEAACRAAMKPELYVTYDAFRQVRAGVPFRQAYKESAKRMKDGVIDVASLQGDFDFIQATLDESVKGTKPRFLALSSRVADWESKLKKVEAEIFQD